MRKKESQSHPHHPPSTKLYIITAAFKHYERNRIDSISINNFNHLIHSITIKFIKNSNQPEVVELFKVTNELIISFMANLSEETYRHTCTHQDIIHFFITLTNYFEKTVNTFGMGDNVIQSTLLKIFWPVFSQSQDASKGMDHSKVDLINNLIPVIEEPRRELINFNVLMRETYTVLAESGKKELGVKDLLISFLRNSSVVSNFKPTMLKYLNISIVENFQQKFKSALMIFQHIGSTFEERRLNLESILLKILDDNKCISFLVIIDSCMNLTKLISPANLPTFVFKITDKIFSKSNISSNSLKILEELSQITIFEFSQSSCEKFFRKGEHLISKFLEWVFAIYLKKDEGENINPIQNMFREQTEFKEEKILEFIKALGNGDKKDELQKVCQYFKKFINNICKNSTFKSKLMIKDLDQIAPLKQSCPSDIIKDFILEVIPPLVEGINFNIKDKSPLKYTIMLKVAELSAIKYHQSHQSLTEKFKEIFFQMLQPESLNFHFIISFIFLKYEKEKEAIREIILNSIISDLEKEGKDRNSRNLIINLSLYLKSYDHLLMNLPIKYKVRQLIKNTEFVVNSLNIGQIMGVQPKEYINFGDNHIESDILSQKMKKLLNKQLSNYSCKDHLSIFYSIAIAINDMVELPNEEVQNSILTRITSLRKRAMLGQLFTNIHLLNESLKNTMSNYSLKCEEQIETYLLILRLTHLTKTNPFKSSKEADELYSLLSQFLVLVNTSFDSDLLENLNSFRENPGKFSYQSYLTLIEERQIIRFYSECSQDLYKMHVVMCRLILALVYKLMEMKDVKLPTVDKKIQIMFLLYSTPENSTQFGITKEHQDKLKNYIMILLLQEKIKNNLQVEPLVKKLFPCIGEIKEIVLEKHINEHILPFKEIYPIDFFSICLTSIRKTLEKDEKDSTILFDLVTKVIEEDEKSCACLLNSLTDALERELSELIFQLIISRVKRGLNLQNKVAFVEQSPTLYKLLSKSLEKDKTHLLGLVEDLVQLDCYSDSEQSAFILKEISYIFINIEERNSQICQTIFNYILTLTEIFGGEEKLQISTFICTFFGLSASNPQQFNFHSLEKPNALTCTNNPNYKCLQCDEKKVVCLGCALTCHENHPVCYLNIPVELKFAKCICSDISCNKCKLNNKDQDNKDKNLIKPKEFPAFRQIGGLMGQPPEIYERMKMPFPSRYARAEGVEQNLSRLEVQAFLREEELLEQELRANQWYENIRRPDRQRERDDLMFRFGGGRLERIVDREDYPGNYRMFIESNQGKKPNKFQPDKKEKQVSEEMLEGDFEEENYSFQKIQEQKKIDNESDDSNTILKKYVLLPKFIDLMVNFCNKKSDKSKSLTNIERWKLGFSNPQISKLPQGKSFKLQNSGSFTFQIRKQNAIHNMSCVLIKKTVAHNHKFLLLASSTEISVFSKQRILSCLPIMKAVPGYNNLSRHSISFQIHSLDFSPVDKGVFCAAGLHNLVLLNLSNEGHISRTSFRYNVSNFYINKIKLTKMGIFLGVDKEIRVLNYSCRHFLTLRAQQAHTIIREWTIFQKAAGCQVLFVCPNGNIFTTDILPSDEDKKEFACKVTDHRINKTGTGASISASDLPDFGKYLFASFKDGSNILGHLQGDQLEDMVNMQLKGLKHQKNIFDQFFIVGHSEIVKMPQAEELFLICTVKKYFPPEMSFHQGFLVAIKFTKQADKKESSSQIIVINDQALCEYFQIIKVGKKNFFILSLHNDGSVQITTLNSISKQIIEEEVASLKHNEDQISQLDAGEIKGTQNVNNLRKNISKFIKFDTIIKDQIISSSYAFREGTESLKTGSDYSLIKHSEIDYELKYNNFSKIITGFSVPFFGEVTLPSRTVKSTFQVGFTPLESLYFYSEGEFKFKYRKNQIQRYARQSFFNPGSHPRMLERIQRIERLNEYQDGEKMFNSHIMNTLMNFKEDSNDIQFIGKSFDNFKSKIPKFQDIFKLQCDDESSSIQKTALIIKMFLTKSLKQGNPCSNEEILNLIQGIKSIIALSTKRLFILLKEIIVLASEVYQKMIDQRFAVIDENYPLRIATESRLQHYYSILKVDISDNQLNEFLTFMLDILKEDENLMTYYISKYSGIFSQLHKRLKKVDTEERAKDLIELYTFAYPIFKYCGVPCSWILVSLCSITFSFNNCKAVRETLYDGIKRSKKISFQEYLKNICSSEGMIVEEQQLLPKESIQQVRDPMAQIYNMFNRGEIDEETLFKMITEASKLEFEKQQQNQMAFEQENQEIQPELQKEMGEEQSVNHNISLVQDLMDQCTDSFNENLEVTYSRVMILYVLSKVADQHFEETTDHLLKRIKKMVSEIDIKSEGDKLTSILVYACLFESVLNNSKYLKKNEGKKYPFYSSIEEEVYRKLSDIRLESVPKITRQLNLLGKVFRNQKAHFNIHIAYALTSLLLFPCEASHVLLSLECYWLLPESKEFYSKKKYFSNITDGIESGNIVKVHQIAKENPQIWQEYNNNNSKLEYVEKWIEEKCQNWELALELLAIYYQD